MVFELCERVESLSVQAFGAVAAEFHEDAGAAGLAADAVSLAVERFEVPAVGALVIDEFDHCHLSDFRDFAPRFKLFIRRSVESVHRRLGRP